MLGDFFLAALLMPQFSLSCAPPPPRASPKLALNFRYKLTDPVSQIRAYVEDVIRGAVPTKTLDQVRSLPGNVRLLFQSASNTTWQL